jgi:hypothetical protein
MSRDLRVNVSLFLGGMLTAVGLYLPPPGPVALWLVHHPVLPGFPPGLPGLFLTWAGAVLVLSGAIYMVLRYGPLVFEVDLSPSAARLFDRTAIGGLDVAGLVVGIGAAAILPWFSPHYLPLGFSLVLGFGALVRLAPLPRSMGAPPPEITPSEVSGTRLGRQTYAWSFECDLGPDRPVRQPQFLELLIDLDLYEGFQARNPSVQRPPGPGDLAELVGNGRTAEVEQVAASIRRTTRTQGYCDYIEVLNAIGFVQSPEAIPYVEDQESKGIAEYWRYPLETLADRAADCECKSILAGSILGVLGRDVLYLTYPPREDRPGHMAIAIEGADSFPPGLHFFPYQQKRYFYCELTAEGWRPGEVPLRLRDLSPEVYVVRPRFGGRTAGGASETEAGA